MRIQVLTRFQISLAFGMLFLLGGNHAIAESVCAARATDQAAQIAPKTPPGVELPFVSPSSAAEYRTRRVVADPFLHRNWALIEDCRHPERPLQMVALPLHSRNVQLPLPQSDRPPVSRATASSQNPLAQLPVALVPPSPPPQMARILQTPSAPAKPPAAMLIRARDRVHLWSIQANVRLEIEVVALEYGHAGQVIHLRRVDQATGQGTTGAMLAGVVTGVDSAELLP